jgi:hypothetical protein
MKALRIQSSGKNHDKDCRKIPNLAQLFHHQISSVDLPVAAIHQDLLLTD